MTLPWSQSSDNGAEKFPMPAVRALANAPQNVTRAVARRTLAPPALPPIAPRRARKARDAAATIGTSAPAGDTTTMSKGMAAPTENDRADVSCGLHGAWGGDLPNPKLIARVGGKGIFRHELLGDLPSKVPIDTTLDVPARVRLLSPLRAREPRSESRATAATTRQRPARATGSPWTTGRSPHPHRVNRWHPLRGA